MRYEPQIRLPGVVYPPAADIRYWSEAGELESTTLADGFREAAGLRPDHAAIISLEGKVSYRELDKATDQAGAGLLRLGLRPLDRVVFQTSNSPEALIAYIACWKAGIIPICTLALHREAEIGFLADFGGARAHVIESDAAKFDFTEFAFRMQARAPSLKHIISIRGTPAKGVSDFQDWQHIDVAEARRELAQVHQDPWQVAAFQLSGGTTGIPKIIPRMHAEYLYNMRRVMSFNRWTRDDRILVPMPFAHNLNMGCAWGSFLMTGGTVIATPSVDIEAMRAVHNRLKPTIMGAAKPIIMRMRDDIAAGNIETTHLRSIFSTDAAEVVTRTMKVPGHQIFGMTEGTVMFTREGDSDHVRYRTCGRPVSKFDDVRLLVPGTEIDVAEGEVGELAARGPYTLRGYYNAPERNAEAFTSDGYYRSGDLMRRHVIDDIAYYSFEGRIKDLVNRADEKVNCEEVERAVMEHPAFSDAAIVGMPSATHGEKVCLFAVPARGAKLPSVEELGIFLKRAGLAVFKWPERIEPIDVLPLTKVGKLDKVALRQRITQILDAENTSQDA